MHGNHAQTRAGGRAEARIYARATALTCMRARAHIRAHALTYARAHAHAAVEPPGSASASAPSRRSCALRSSTRTHGRARARVRARCERVRHRARACARACVCCARAPIVRVEGLGAGAQHLVHERKHLRSPLYGLLCRRHPCLRTIQTLRGSDAAATQHNAGDPTAMQRRRRWRCNGDATAINGTVI
jgi:hypothetical protein